MMPTVGHCAIEPFKHKSILLGHGSGGKLMHELIEGLFQASLLPADIGTLNDSYVFDVAGSRLAITTDSFVVDPIFFPGGDIGKLAVNGTINDLACCGAQPLLLTTAFILEEGFPMADLEQIVTSIRAACEVVGIKVVTGDTKVVNRGKCDKLFVNTTGIGLIEHDVQLSANKLTPGDVLLLNGHIASHGIAVLAEREKLDVGKTICSDTQPLCSLVKDMLDTSLNISCMRDLTRGGLASALNELAASSKVGIRIDEDSIAIADEVKGVCEVLGLDPLHVANEGKLVAVAAKQDAGKILESMKQNPYGQHSAIIGEVVAHHPGMVVMKTTVGGNRIVTMLTAEQLPRIC